MTVKIAIYTEGGQCMFKEEGSLESVISNFLFFITEKLGVKVIK